MRLDKFLCDAGAGTRSEVKSLIKKGFVTVNGLPVKDADRKVKEEEDCIALRGEEIFFSRYHYYMLHKPAGVITATEDRSQKTVMELLTGVNTKNLFPVGRLDKDTEGLLLLTDDGELAHKLLSPKKHVDKTYLVHLKKPLNPEDVKKLEGGVDIGDDVPTLPALVKELSDTQIELTIREGRFHQIKRMLQAVDNEVIYLKRLSMGPLHLPKDLEKGTFRPLNPEELQALKQEKLL
ncbi:MAG: pseudouridine synthase [Lachnospiraceae bacterium]